MNDALSQEEINALLNGGMEDEVEDNNATDMEDILTDLEKDALGEVANISMGSAATALYGLLNQKVEITTPRVEFSTVEDLVDSYNRPCIVVDVQYVEGLKGSNQLILEVSDAAIITDLMMGGDGTAPPEELSELHISAVGEAMNQMMGSASTSMSDFFEGDKINISPPKAELLELSSDIFNLEGVGDKDVVVKVVFDMHIGDLIDSQIIQVMTIDFAQKLANALMGSMDTSGADEPANQGQSSNSNQTQQQPQQGQQQQAQPQMNQQQTQQQGQPMYQQPMYQQPMPQQNVEVQSVEFNELGMPQGQGLNNDIRLIHDVPLELTVRLGKTRMSIKDILELGPGSVIELDRLAGEAVDLLVNGKLIAKGEVVVIDENFGFRVTDIVSSEERLRKL
ncbi:flagellar motor switch protein FliN/FliY [Orenia metallireducens]|jgi:flagellar motor switch protein FliN/FliY|uniref:Flagellar motor switch protein FliN/FliY n=2 Tax=Orenia metallireducens TaxID=1413210 RepID=A0A285FPB8_9FIRM|nr:flagellar motor switch protein FliN/FliY [Orenia metallireducens]SNY13028.1 flagellar motor switch protein FliN/FliY [Orenia metallireducens]